MDTFTDRYNENKSKTNHLEIGGLDTVDLVKKFGTLIRL